MHFKIKIKLIPIVIKLQIVLIFIENAISSYCHSDCNPVKSINSDIQLGILCLVISVSIHLSTLYPVEKKKFLFNYLKKIFLSL